MKILIVALVCCLLPAMADAEKRDLKLKEGTYSVSIATLEGKLVKSFEITVGKKDGEWTCSARMDGYEAECAITTRYYKRDSRLPPSTSTIIVEVAFRKARGEGQEPVIEKILLGGESRWRPGDNPDPSYEGDAGIAQLNGEFTHGRFLMVPVALGPPVLEVEVVK